MQLGGNPANLKNFSQFGASQFASWNQLSRMEPDGEVGVPALQDVLQEFPFKQELIEEAADLNVSSLINKETGESYVNCLGNAIWVMNKKMNSKGKTADKINICFACGTESTKIERHWVVNHAKESLVKEISSHAKGSAERSLLSTKLRNIGNHLHNMNVMQDGGEIIVARSGGDLNPNNYLPCANCFAWIGKRERSRHKCPMLLPGQPNSFIEAVMQDVQTESSFSKACSSEDRSSSFNSDRSDFRPDVSTLEAEDSGVGAPQSLFEGTGDLQGLQQEAEDLQELQQGPRDLQELQQGPGDFQELHHETGSLQDIHHGIEDHQHIQDSYGNLNYQDDEEDKHIKMECKHESEELDSSRRKDGVLEFISASGKVVWVMGKRRNSKGKTAEKINVCYSCGAESSKIERHWYTNHGEEPQVQKIESLEKGSTERSLMSIKLRNLGNHQHNLTVMREGGGIIVTRTGGDNNPNNYVTCANCLAWIMKRDRVQHRCPVLVAGMRDKNTFLDNLLGEGGEEVTGGWKEAKKRLLPDTACEGKTDQEEDMYEPWSYDISSDSKNSPSFDIKHRRKRIKASEYQEDSSDKGISNRKNMKSNTVRRASKKNIYEPQEVHMNSNGKPVWVLNNKRNSKGKIANKINICFACGKESKKIDRHLSQVHATENEVLEMELYPKGSAERSRVLSKLRLLGNHLHNKKAMELGGGVIVARFGRDLNPNNYEPCPHCLVWIVMRDHFRHKCRLVPPGEAGLGGSRVRGRGLGGCRGGRNVGPTRSTGQESEPWCPEDRILKRLKKDEISILVKNDLFIRSYVRTELEGRDEPDRLFDSSLRRRLRFLGFFKKAFIQKYPLEDNQLDRIISTKNWDCIVQAARDTAVLCNSDKSSSTPLKVGFALQKIFHRIKDFAVMEDDFEKLEDIDRVIELYKKEWYQRVSSISLQLSKDRKRDKEYFADLAEKYSAPTSDHEEEKVPFFPDKAPPYMDW